MLFIFRKLRRSFFPLRQEGSEGHVLPGKVRTYFAYAIGEVVLIVIGILIAVEIGEWNQARQDDAEETAILLRLRSEFLTNQKHLKVGKRELTKNANEMLDFLTIMSPQPDTYPDDMVNRGIGTLLYNPGTTLSAGVIDSLFASGKIGLIKNDKLNYLLSLWPRLLDRYEDEVADLDEDYLINWEFVSNHHQFRDNLTGAKRRYKTAGPSRFDYDQSKLLAHPKLENLVEMKRLATQSMIETVERFQQHQQEILDLIDTELAERGIASDS